jgi:hypothetical protein
MQFIKFGRGKRVVQLTRFPAFDNGHAVEHRTNQFVDANYGKDEGCC